MSEREWNVGDKVQQTKNQTIRLGEIVNLIKETQEVADWYGSSYGSRRTKTEEYTAKLEVKWSDGQEETLAVWDVEPEDNEMEREFRALVPDAMKKIDEKLALASKYLDEAIAISEETGVPFSSNISFLGQSYKPTSFEKKFPEVDRELMTNLTGSYNEYAGWQHSAVC